MILETIAIQPPEGPRSYATIEVRPNETPEGIAFREAVRRRLALGTILVLREQRWGIIDGNGSVALCQEGPQPGEVWKPKDKRRKSGFRVKAVQGSTVVADDGRTIKLDRMKRYERVG